MPHTYECQGFTKDEVRILHNHIYTFLSFVLTLCMKTMKYVEQGTLFEAKKVFMVKSPLLNISVYVLIL